jgi:hypothetical protein
VKGSKNKRTQELEKKAKEGITPLDYMLQVMRDESADAELRADMAKASAPYLHARRAPEDRQGKTVPPMVYMTPNLESEDE